SNGEGSGIVVPGTGLHLNNMLGEQDLNPLGFHRHPPGRRMPSMMSPTMVLGATGPELMLGSGGSNRIRSAITETIVNVRGRGMRLGHTVPGLLAAGALLAGCGQAGADLFVVTRTGQGPGAALTLRVADDGFVRCNGGSRRRITDQQLLLAREIERELDGD